MNSTKFGRLGFVLLVLGITSFLRWWLVYEQPLQGIDDANIYFVYAKNLAEGNGFVYHPGGERVEGFTSMLWTLLLAFFYLLGPMELLALFANFFLVAYSLYRLSLLADKLNPAGPSFGSMCLSSCLLLLFVLLIPGYIDWTIFTHMETGLWSCLLILSCVFLFEQLLEFSRQDSTRQQHPFPKLKKNKLKRGFTMLIPLLVFTRPESMLWVPLFILLQWGQQYLLKQSFSRALRGVLAPGIAFAASLLLLFSFRLSYFGYPFPNTFYAKVSNSLGQNIIDGAYYLLRYSKENPFIPLFSLLLALSFIFLLRNARLKQLNAVSAVQLSIILLCALNFLLPFYAGGDHFYLSRFYQPLYPVLLLGVFNLRFWKAQSKLRLHLHSGRQSFFLLLFFGLLILASTGLALFDESPIQKEFDHAQYGRETGRKLNTLFADSKNAPSVGTYLAGGLAYTYKGKTIDLLGLNNTRIAHAPKDREGGYKNHDAFNKKIFYELAPDIVHMDFVETPQKAALYEQDSTDFQNQVYKYIFLEDRFRNLYAPVVIADENEKEWYQAYVHQNFLGELRKEDRKFYIISRKNSLKKIGSEIMVQLSLKKGK